MSFGLGIIGAGAIGRIHAETATRSGLDVVGAWDVDPAKSEAFAADFEGTKAVVDLDALLAMDEVRAVVVAVPNDAHRENAIRAMRAGKDVLLEKPMALNAAECDEIISVMEETGRRVQLGFVYRGTPVSLAAKDFIDAGRLGNIYHAKASLYRRRGIPGLGGWFTTKSRSGGGPLIDLGVHVIDLVLHLVGYPAARRASAACYSTFGSPMESYRYVDMWAGPPRFEGTFDVEDAAHGLIRFDGGFTLEVNVTWAANIPEGVLSDGVVLCGDRGGCAFNLLGQDLTIATEEEGHIVDVKPTVEPIDVMDAAWAKQYEQFIDVVTNGTAPVASSANGRAIQAILDAMYESSAEQREVEVR